MTPEEKLNEISRALPPGSEIAQRNGCKCPAVDNGYGRGYMGMPGVYVYNLECPVHEIPFVIVQKEEMKNE
jgi:hypothetical protein